MNRIYVAIGVIVLLLLAGCKGKQLLPTPQPPVSSEVKENFEALIASYPQWETFSSKGEVEVEMGAGKSLAASTQVKMVRGEMLQISVRVVLGIEVARVVVTPDSAFVLNKLKRQVYAQSLDVVSEKLSTPLSLETIQDALLGRIFLLDSKHNNYTLSDFDISEGDHSQWTISPRKQKGLFFYEFDLQDVNLLTTRAGSVGSNKSVTCKYSEFIKQGSSENFPTRMLLSLTGLSVPMSMELHYNPSSIVWNEPVRADNLNLSKYTRVSVSQMLKML